nr:hypothetical protein B0A51_09817 [Rachicladosporium sp. CCFEE 5018]
MANLIELDSLEILAIIDNELDPISQSPNSSVIQTGGLKEIGLRGLLSKDDPRGAGAEMRMDKICCSAHGLSLLITAVVGDTRRTILFDTGPEESAWERNAARLGVDAGVIERVVLSHWHRDHSGGMLKVLEHFAAARKGKGGEGKGLPIDLHPARPDFRGVQPPGMPVFSLEADPTFESIEGAGGVVEKSDQVHDVLDGHFAVSGEIPRVTDYEVGLKFGVRFDSETGKWGSDEKMADERLLLCKVKGKGIVVFTGCSHAGVVNASRHAVELGGGAPLYAVVGGFHLADGQPPHIQSTVNDLKALDVQVLLAGHCTGWRAKYAIEKEMPGRLVPSFVGSKYTL